MPPPDRRTTPRHPTSMGADLWLPGQPTRRVRLHDLAQGGARLMPTGLPLALRVGVRVALGLRLPSARGDTYFRLEAQVIRLDASGAALQFLAMPQGLAATLHDYLHRQALQHALHNTQVQARVIYQRKLEAAVRNSVGAAVTQLLGEFLEQLVYALETQAALANNDVQAGQTRDDAARLRHAVRRESLAARLAVHWLELGQPNAALAPALLNETTTRLWLARRQFIETLECALAIPLKQIAQRLSELAAGELIPPLAPRTLADHLERALTTLDLSLDGRLMVLAAAAHLSTSLAELYPRLLQSLATLEPP